MILSALVASSLLLVLLHHIFIYIKRSRYKHIPSVPIPISPSWCLGHTLIFKEIAQKHQWNLCLAFETMRQLSSAGGDTCVIFLGFGNQPNLYTTDRDIYARFLSDHRVYLKQSPRDSLLDFVNGLRILGKNSLVIDPGTEVWYSKRRAMDPAFQKKFLRQLHDQMTGVADKLCGYLADRQGTEVEIHSVMVRVALEVVCTCGFDLREDFVINEDSHIKNSLDKMFAILHIHIFNIIGFCVPWKFREEKAVLKEAVNFLRDFVGFHLKERFDKISAETGNGHHGDDMLTHIIKANVGTGLSLEDVVDDFFLFLIAGMETTAISLSGLLWECLKNKEISQRIAAEVLEVAGGRDEIGFDDLNHLTYLEQCIKETLRLHGPAPGTFRVSPPTNATTVNNLLVPPDTKLFVNIQQSHMNEENWENPTKFNPERFSASSKVKPFTFLPFSAGPRICIGKQFAMMEMKIIVARLFMKFELYDPYPSERELEKEMSLSIRPKRGIYIGVTEKR